jgi:hypothetical protein
LVLGSCNAGTVTPPLAHLLAPRLHVAAAGRYFDSSKSIEKANVFNGFSRWHPESFYPSED